MNIIQNIITKLQSHTNKITIIFPEGHVPLIQEIAIKAHKYNIKPILVFKTSIDCPKSIFDNKEIDTLFIDENDLDTMANFLYQLRKNKITIDEAKELVKKPNYFSVLKVKMGDANGMVGGIEYATKDILRPALQIIKPRSGYKLVSSAFLLTNDDKNYIFTDCALNLYPNSEQLSYIAKLGYEASQLFDFKNPQMALLSYSTKGSGVGPSVDIVKGACEILKSEHWHKCLFDGELQLDSAICTNIRRKKAPNSILQKDANILVFPNIDAANIGYKLVQRLANYNAVGPVIMGLDKPINDLSRGASFTDVLYTAVITAYSYLLDYKGN